MSLLFLESFDDGLHLLKMVWTGPAITTGRNGNGVLFTDSDDIRKPLTAAEEHATIITGFAYRMNGAYPSSAAQGEYLQFRSDAGGTLHVSIGFNSAGILQAYRSTFGSGTLLGTATMDPISLNVWHYIEVLVTLSDAAGVVTVIIDGVQVLNLTGIDTKNAGVKTVIDDIYFEVGSSSPDMLMDDLYICNGAGAAPHNTFLGDVVVEVLLPVGNGNANTWIGSDGNSVDNYLLVDEAAPDGDTTYVSSAVDGDIDLYAFADLAVPAATIRGVIARADARHTGAADNARLLTRIAGANYNGSDQAVASSYDDVPAQVWQVSPATAVVWTVAEINAAEFGIENRP